VLLALLQFPATICTLYMSSIDGGRVDFWTSLGRSYNLVGGWGWSCSKVHLLQYLLHSVLYFMKRLLSYLVKDSLMKKSIECDLCGQSDLC
jgi:hypothetical protein